MKTWTANNKFYKYAILNVFSKNLYDIYYPYRNGYEIWNMFSNKCIIEEARSHQCFIGDFLHFMIVENKSVTDQIHD